MKKVGLIILDGWGNGTNDASNAIFEAHPPYFRELLKTYPSGELLTHGGNVGLPDGQMGNSEVGHLNIGAGRIVFQDLVRINNDIKSGAFDENPTLRSALEAAASKGRLHLMGLVSDGGVHSHIEHLKALVRNAHTAGVEHIYIHAFTDGRDCDPHSGKVFIEDVSEFAEKHGARIVSVIGRYYAMDRDKRWERVKKAYDLLVNRKGTLSKTASDAIRMSYENGITDEFVEPHVIGSDTEAAIKPGDTVICFNFRTDRCREITMVLTQQEFPDFEMQTLELQYYTMTEYDKNFRNVHVLYHKDNLEMTLGEYIAGKGLKQVRVAETEKYPHVTFFFSGGREEPFAGEERILINSPKVATYDLQPEMSAPEVTAAVVDVLNRGEVDFMCLNFANPDMVGHTGVFEAVKKAVLTVDSCLEEVITAGLANNYSFVVIADHGNADKVINDDGTPNTAHTTNPVPVIVVDNSVKEVHNGILADVAPTILKLMELEVPAQITGKALI